MTERDDDTDQIERPVQATPEFFLDTVAEHEERGDIEEGVCVLRMTDGSRRRFVIDVDLDEIDEDDYLLGTVDDLIAQLEANDVDGEFETRISVDDVDRVVEEARDEGIVTVRFTPEGLSGLLAAFLATVIGDGNE